MKSLSTGYRTEAIRKARIVAASLEAEWCEVERHGVLTTPAAHLVVRPKPSPASPVAPVEKTMREAFELFRSDPAKQRTRKTDLHYLNLIELTVGLWGEQRAIRTIDREACRELLDTLLWLPTNAGKRFPKLSPVAAAQKAKEKGLTGILSPASINGYMTKFRAVMNYAANEGWIERNPAKGLQVIDRVRRRDKRLPFSTEQLRLIFDAPIYRGWPEQESRPIPLRHKLVDDCLFAVHSVRPLPGGAGLADDEAEPFASGEVNRKASIKEFSLELQFFDAGHTLSNVSLLREDS